MTRFAYIFLFLYFCIVHTHAGINPIVRVSVDKGGIPVSFNLRLFDDVVPATTSNFLNYVNATTANGGRYNKTFFHRYSQNFVLQTGGFSFDSMLGRFSYDNITNTYPGGLQEITVDTAITNDFNLANTRGSIAMGKKPARYKDAKGVSLPVGACTVTSPDCILLDGTGPDSATSQWFINLVDNNVLDQVSNNGGFTVFAEVLQDGMAVIDDLVSSEIFNLEETTNFKALPLIGYTVGQLVEDKNLIKIVSLEEVFKISSDFDFGDELIGSTVDTTVTIQSLESTALTIGAIDDTELSAPFSLVQNNCQNVTLMADTSCDITVRYEPTLISSSVGKINIIFPSIAASHVFRVEASNAPDISINLSDGAFGVVPLFDPTSGNPEQLLLVIENLGVKDLIFENTEIIFENGSGSQFNIIDNCENKTLSPKSTGSNFSCGIPVNFVGTALGDFSFILTVVSNDPDQPRIDIPFTATVVNDTDGVIASIENNSPNKGDGNFDNKLDSLQSNVTSLLNSIGDYVTLVSSSFIEFTNVTFESIASFRVPYAPANLEDGVISFEIKNMVPGAALTVGFILPRGFVYDDFKLLIQNVITLEEQWGDSNINGVDGVNNIGATEFTSGSGDKESRNILLITFVEGGYGDIDLQENGVLSVKGLLLIKSENTSGSGKLQIFFVAALFLLLTLLRVNIFDYFSNTAP